MAKHFGFIKFLHLDTILLFKEIDSLCGALFLIELSAKELEESTKMSFMAAIVSAGVI
ncbi:MAG: hypothetical protein K2X27_02115 [Candidatus Obscuribacterales bacterium]|nr:hypothetical protein [Candidatus Obscuribacterales bacterium]